MRPADLRDLISAMDAAPWYSATSRHQSDCVLTGAPNVTDANDGRVIAQANSNFPYRANLDGIVALRNHGEGTCDVLDAVRHLLHGAESGVGVSELYRRLGALRLTMDALDRIP